MVTVLNLRALELALDQLAACGEAEHVEDAIEVLKQLRPIVATIRPLLAHARALREVLRKQRTYLAVHGWDLTEIDVTLAQAVDPTGGV